MKKLLYVVGSPRAETSYSSQIAEAFLDAFRQANPDYEIDVLDLWQEAIPAFDGDKAAAKMTVIAGSTLEGRQATAWDEITGIIERFAAADHYLFTVPMWNGTIPYRLKLLIDTVTQPGLLFGFDPEAGYIGLLENKKATVIYSSGVYANGVPSSFGLDFQQPYFNWWLRLIGIEEIEEVTFAGNMMGADPQNDLEQVKLAAQALVINQGVLQRS